MDYLWFSIEFAVVFFSLLSCCFMVVYSVLVFGLLGSCFFLGWMTLVEGQKGKNTMETTGEWVHFSFYQLFLF